MKAYLPDISKLHFQLAAIDDLLLIWFLWFYRKWLILWFIITESHAMESLHVVVDEDMLLALAHQSYKAGNYKQSLDHCNAVYERNSLRTDNLLLMGAIYYQVLFIWMKCLLCWFVLHSIAWLVLYFFEEYIATYFSWYKLLFVYFRVLLPSWVLNCSVICSGSPNWACFSVYLQLHDFDMCIARNEEALQIDPRFAECYGNMANAWKVIIRITELVELLIHFVLISFFFFLLKCRRRAMLILQFATIWSLLRFVCTYDPCFLLSVLFSIYSSFPLDKFVKYYWILIVFVLLVMMIMWI